MKNKSFAVAKTNFRNIKLAYMITFIIMGCIFIQDIVYIILSFFDIWPGADNATIGIGNYLWLLIILSAIFIPSLNFRKMMNLGAKRGEFFTGCAINYIIITFAASLAGIILYYTYEAFILKTIYIGPDSFTLNPIYWFGWVNNGPVIAFFQQFAFLLFAAVFIHTLTAIQDKWYGWVTDVVIVAIISVFTPIAPLRSALVWFFYVIIFNTNWFLQILACLILSVVIYALNKFIFARKPI
jgi:hypothetical protein